MKTRFRCPSCGQKFKANISKEARRMLPRCPGAKCGCSVDEEDAIPSRMRALWSALIWIPWLVVIDFPIFVGDKVDRAGSAVWRVVAKPFMKKEKIPPLFTGITVTAGTTIPKGAPVWVITNEAGTVVSVSADTDHFQFADICGPLAKDAGNGGQPEMLHGPKNWEGKIHLPQSDENGTVINDFSDLYDKVIEKIIPKCDCGKKTGERHAHNCIRALWLIKNMQAVCPNCGIEFEMILERHA